MNTPSTSPTPERTVLIVEDEARLRDMLEQAIRGMDFNPQTAASGEVALRMLDENAISIVIVDLHLPGMDGLSFIENARQRCPDLSAIVLTGYGDLESARRAMHLDVVEFLTKPCTLGEIESSLDRAWRRCLVADRPRAAKDAGLPQTTVGGAAKLLSEIERDVIMEALRRHDGNRESAAVELGISVRTLYYRLSTYEAIDRLKGSSPPAGREDRVV